MWISKTVKNREALRKNPFFFGKTPQLHGSYSSNEQVGRKFNLVGKILEGSKAIFVKLAMEKEIKTDVAHPLPQILHDIQQDCVGFRG